MPGLRARRKFRPGTRRSGVAALTAPVNTAAPVVTPSSVSTGGTLTTTNGAWSGNPSPTFTYQWQKAGVNIVAATTNSYVVQAGDVGSAITCNVTGTNSQGSATAASNGVTPTSGTFAPTDITGIQGWWKADAGTSTTTDGAGVSSWSDQSGNARTLTQATGSAQPIYKAAGLNGKPTLRLSDAASQCLTRADAAGIAALPLTICMVISETVAGTYKGAVVKTGASTDGLGFGLGNAAFENAANNVLGLAESLAWVDPLLTFPSLTAHVLTMVWTSGNVCTIYKDGVAGTARTQAINAASAAFSIGGYNPGAANRFFTGDVAEVVTYNSALSTTDRQSLEAYLKARWGTP